MLNPKLEDTVEIVTCPECMGASEYTDLVCPLCRGDKRVSFLVAETYHMVESERTYQFFKGNLVTVSDFTELIYLDAEGVEHLRPFRGTKSSIRYQKNLQPENIFMITGYVYLTPERIRVYKLTPRNSGLAQTFMASPSFIHLVSR